MHSARGVSKCRRGSSGGRGVQRLQSNKTFFMTVPTAAVVVCLPRTRHLSLLPLPCLCLSACLVCFSHFPQAKPSQAKANAADAFFWARNKIDPGKSRLEINLARPAQAAGGTWAVVCVWQVNQPKKSQEPSDSCLAPLPRPQPKYVLSFACRQRALAKCNIECIPPATPPPHTQQGPH